VLKIGLTGGIGCGKSTVTKYFTKLKIPVIDADKIAHDLTQPGTIAYKKIISHFGTNFLTPQKKINRRKLREVVFYNPQKRIWLENLLHPKILTLMKKLASKIKAPYCIMSIPLLFETKLMIKLDRILVIDCSQKNQINRARKRDYSSIKQIKEIIKTQTKRKIRLQKADDVIQNNTSLENLKKEVKKLHDFYLSIT